MEQRLRIIPGMAATGRPAAPAPVPPQGRPRLVRVALALGAAVALAGAAALWAWPIGEPERLGALQGDAWSGAYLARASGCVACHTAPGGQALAGGAPLETPFGTFVPPNITRDASGGIGGWTLDEFAVAVRQGVAPEGHAYYPAFPYEFYAGFSDQEVADLFAAIQAVPPVAEPAPAHDVGFPFNMRMGLKLWRAAFLSEPYVTPVMGRSELWNRGQALVEGASHCAACHTGRNLLGGLDPDERMAGSDALPGGERAPSIRRDDLLARGWTPANLAYALRTGVAPDGDALGGAMAEAIHQGTSFLDEADREAIAVYLLDADEVGAAVAAAIPEAAPMEGMDDMAGMDHAAMTAAAGTAAPGGAEASAVTAVQATSAMEGMDHSMMVMDSPEGEGAAGDADQGAAPAWTGLRPQPRPQGL
jgi:mono/diheme cytochrome c family protein